MPRSRSSNESCTKRVRVVSKSRSSLCHDLQRRARVRSYRRPALMIRTPVCALLGIEHPIVLGGMGTGTSPELVAAVSSAGGLGILGASRQTAEELAREVAAIRAATDRPFGLNLLLFRERPGQYDALVAARPKVISTAWSTLEQ